MEKACKGGTGLERMFSPESVAVIGVSTDPEKLGHKVFSNLIKGGFRGEAYPVNPRGGEILGRRMYGSVVDIPGEVDIAFICVPSGFVRDVLVDCGEKGIGFAVVITAGFREAGNMDGEEELLTVARRYGMRVLGPNVFGIIYTPSSLSAQFGASEVIPGPVSIITQSGALGATLMGRVFQEGLGVAGVVSTGNKADIGDEDLLPFFCSDPNTEVILMYMEGLRDGRQFMKEVWKVSGRKPVVVLKSGRSGAGARAAASHTASLAGEDAVFNGALKQAGVLRAPTLREALDWTRSFHSLPRPRAGNVFIITNGGGLGILALDKLDEYGIPLFNDEDWVRDRLYPRLTSLATGTNPLDITAQTPPGKYIECLEMAIENDSIGVVIGIFGTTSGTDVEGFTRDLIRRIGRPAKPLVMCTIGGRSAMDQVEAFNRAGLPSFCYPEEAASTVGALLQWESTAGRELFEEGYHNPWDLEKVDAVLGRTATKGVFIDPLSSLDILSAGPFKIPPYRGVRALDEALLFAKEHGYPVVLKAASADIVHKAERGGVIAGIGCDEELRASLDRIAGIPGEALIMKQATGGEFIMGAVRDPVFGPVVMFGPGGSMVAALGDVSFRVAPACDADIDEMMKETRAGLVLDRLGGAGASVREALRGAIKSLGILLLERGDIAEIEVNPLMVREDGAEAVDCRVRIE